ncbi:hypothetical protein NQ176_g3735 [Zarea fungicola]|uniref:Uncharacterized protein n=1 Tax=Zarea fungicola TaxID=93591 RepID=A0ACC1NJH5_9HYPO|nr:hypothetical protein NQ176_g3735 [Lecanicillium fungicola]
MDEAAQQTSQSYMAVHDPESCFQNIEVVVDNKRLQEALRRSIDLSSDFPIRWVVHQNLTVIKGNPESAFTVYAVGHHIAVDGSSMSHVSRELLELASTDIKAAPTGLASPSYGEFVQRQNAYLRSPEAESAKAFWLSQVANTKPYDWKHAIASTPCADRDYRQMNTWAFFPNETLAAWSKLYPGTAS